WRNDPRAGSAAWAGATGSSSGGRCRQDSTGAECHASAGACSRWSARDRIGSVTGSSTCTTGSGRTTGSACVTGPGSAGSSSQCTSYSRYSSSSTNVSSPPYSTAKPALRSGSSSSSSSSSTRLSGSPKPSRNTAATTPNNAKNAGNSIDCDI